MSKIMQERVKDIQYPYRHEVKLLLTVLLTFSIPLIAEVIILSPI